MISEPPPSMVLIGFAVNASSEFQRPPFELEGERQGLVFRNAALLLRAGAFSAGRHTQHASARHGATRVHMVGCLRPSDEWQAVQVHDPVHAGNQSRAFQGLRLAHLPTPVLAAGMRAMKELESRVLGVLHETSFE